MTQGKGRGRGKRLTPAQVQEIANRYQAGESAMQLGKVFDVSMADLQGLGLGGHLCETVGDILLSEGKRFYAKTAHYWVGEHRNRSDKWRPTQTNQKKRRLSPGRKSPRLWKVDTERVCYSHEYIGKGR